MAFSTLFQCLFAFFCCLIVSEAAGSKVCSSAPYKDLLFLSDYAPAKSYCSARYPLPTTTVTVTSPAPKKPRSAAATATATKAGGNDIAWSILLSTAKSIISTACSCIETPPTKTVTVSPKSSATGCNPGKPQPTFILLASGSGTTDDGRYALMALTGDSDAVTFADDVTAATAFTFNDACNLVGYGEEIACTDAGASYETLFFNTAAQIAANGYVPATCNIVNNKLTCTDQTAKTLVVCTTLLQLQIAAAVPTGCAAVTLKPIYQ